jgi:hypothetical protein
VFYVIVNVIKRRNLDAMCDSIFFGQAAGVNQSSLCFHVAQSKWRRQAAADQSADRSAHSRELIGNLLQTWQRRFSKIAIKKKSSAELNSSQEPGRLPRFSGLFKRVGILEQFRFTPGAAKE